MPINPENYSISDEELRERLLLIDEDRIIPYGYETRFNNEEKSILKNNYDFTSLFVRLHPDYIIVKDVGMSLVEGKQDCVSVEALQLFFNQHLAKAGVKIVYSFPKFNIPVEKIPFNTIFVPELHKKEFDENIKDHIMRNCPYVQIIYCENTRGSNDPFVRVDLRELQLLA